MKTQLVESHRARVRRIEARRAEGGRPERVHRGRALAAAGGRGRRHPARGPGGGGSADRGARASGARSATRPPWTRAGGAARGGRGSDVNIMPATLAAAKAGATTGEWAARAARGLRRVPRADRRGRRGRGAPTTTPWPSCATAWSACPRRSGGGSRSWWASRGSTATPTAPSRSPCAPATPAWTWSTRASA